MNYDIYARCNQHCKSERCDDYGADICVNWHTELEHFEGSHELCGKAAFLSHGCGVCEEMVLIHKEIQEGKIPERICHECYSLFELSAANPYGEILFQEDVGVYFECDACFVLEIDDTLFTDN